MTMKLLCLLGVHKWVLTDIDPDGKDGPVDLFRCDRPCRKEKRAAHEWEDRGKYIVWAGLHGIGLKGKKLLAAYRRAEKKFKPARKP